MNDKIFSQCGDSPGEYRPEWFMIYDNHSEISNSIVVFCFE